MSVSVVGCNASRRSLDKRIGQVFDDVPWSDARVVIDLDGAAVTGDGDGRVSTSSNGRKQAMLADRSRYFVMFDLMPKRPGHAAATAVNLGDGTTESVPQQRNTVLRTDQRLLMTVGVIQQRRCRSMKSDRIRILVEKALQEGLDHHALSSNASRRIESKQARVVVDERQNAARLDTDDRRPGARESRERANVGLRKLLRLGK